MEVQYILGAWPLRRPCVEAGDIAQFNERVWLRNDPSDSYIRKGNQSHIS